MYSAKTAVANEIPAAAILPLCIADAPKVCDAEIHATLH